MQSITRDPKLAGKRLERETVRRVWGYARKYRSRLGIFVVAIVLDALVVAGPPLLLRELLGAAIPDRDKALVVWLALGTLGLALADGGLTLLQRYLSAQVGEGLIYDLRTELYDHVQRMPVAFFTRTQTGALVSRLNNDVVGAQRAVTSTLSMILSNAISVATTLVVMAVLSWQVTLLALVVLPVFIASTKWVGRRLRAVNLESMNLNASMTTMMTERFNVAGAMLVKLFGRADHDVGEFASRAERVRDIGVLNAVYMRTFMTTLGLVAAVATAGLYLIGGLSAITHTARGTMQAATIAALGMYIAQLYSPLTALTTARVDYLTAVQGFERVFEVLDLEQSIADRPDAVPLEDVAGLVRLEHVSFNYPAGAGVVLESLQDSSVQGVDSDVMKTVLHDIDFEVLPGQMVALVGPSGAGKTTIAQLVVRLYDPTEGSVTIDGHDLRDVTLASLATAVGVVTQDPHLFHESVAANLRFAKPSATEADLEAACRMANIHDVVAALPDGYETIVGERGYRLSGGEKQRLAIARMLLGDPRVVVLDEATSHLDSENEALIQRALDAALAGRSSLVIAHRLSTVVAADRILVIDGGRVVESGTHEELVAAGGLYADLYSTQFARPAV